MIAWLSAHIHKLEAAFRGPLSRLNPQNHDTFEENI